MAADPTPTAASSPVTTTRGRAPGMGFILVTLILDVLGFSLLIPVGPRLVQSLLNDGQGGTAAQAAPVVGWLMTTWYIMSFLFAPMLGNLSDRYGRRPVLLVALFGSGLDFFAQALAPSLTWFFITRALNGLSGASMTVATAYVADITPPQKRAASFGLMYAAVGLGFTIGPLLGGLLGSIDLRLPFFVAGGMTMLNWLYGLLVLPESLPPERRRAFDPARANPLGALHGLGRYPLVAGLAAAMFLLHMAQFALHATWVLYTAHRYGWSTTQVGYSLFAVGVGAAIVQGGLARRLIPAMGEKRALLVGLAFGVAAYVGYGLATEGWMIYVVLAAASIGGLAQPAAQALITHSVKPTEQGEIQGAIAGLQSIAGIIGPIVGGSVLHYTLADTAHLTAPGATYFVSAVLAGLGWLAAAWAVGRRSTRSPSAAREPAPAPPGAE